MVIGTWQQGLYGALILPKMKGNRGGTPRKVQTNLPCEVKAQPSRVALSIGIQGQCLKARSQRHLPWPMETEGRLEELSGHGLGALDLGWQD